MLVEYNTHIDSAAKLGLVIRRLFDHTHNEDEKCRSMRKILLWDSPVLGVVPCPLHCDTQDSAIFSITFSAHTRTFKVGVPRIHPERIHLCHRHYPTCLKKSMVFKEAVTIRVPPCTRCVLWSGVEWRATIGLPTMALARSSFRVAERIFLNHGDRCPPWNLFVMYSDFDSCWWDNTNVASFQLLVQHGVPRCGQLPVYVSIPPESTGLGCKAQG